MEKPPNSCLSILNGIGKLSSGLLGAPYALAQKVKSAAVATIETMSNKNKRKEKEELAVSLKRNYELELLIEQEERTKLLGKAKEEQKASIDQLNSAKGAITSLGQELKKESELKTPEDNQQAETTPEMEKPSNSCLSLLNGIGKSSSSLLGAPYALAQKVKSAAVATIETMSNKNKRKKKEELAVSLKRNYELELLNEQEERTKLLGKAKEEQKASIDQLNSAKGAITSLGQEPKKESELKTPEDNQQAETTPEMEKPSNSCLSLLNGIGKLSSGLLGAPYALAQKVKSTTVATIETMSNKNKRKKKEELAVSLKRNYELELLNEQEERTKLLGKAKEEQKASIDQLNSAKGAITSLGQELKKESELKTPKDNQQAETAPEMEKPSNSCLSLLNGIGKLSSSLLGAPNALAQKVKSAAVATIEIMSNKNKRKEKEELVVSLKRNYELELLNEQEERTKLLGKAKEEQKASIDQLKSAKGVITSLGQELKKESELKTPEDNQQAETAPKMEKPPNSCLSLLNGIGKLSSGLLGAPYALAQKVKSAAVATIETISNKKKLKEKEELIVSLKRNCELELLNEQEERTKLLGKAKEEQKALIDQLNSAKGTITSLGQELKSEKSLTGELKLQFERLETELSKTDSDKKDLEVNLKEKVDSIEILQKRIDLLSADLKDKEHVVQSLNSSLAEKELELKNLNSTYEQSKDELSNAHLQIQGLKDEILKSQNELEGKDSLVMDLNSRVSSLTLENNNFRSKHDVMEKEYSDLKLTSEKKVASDAKALREKEDELHQLKDKFELVLHEAKKNQVIIADLTQEREGLKESLENESKKVNHLKHEHEVARENLEKLRNGSIELEKRVNQANELRKELELQVSQLSSELTEVKESLQSKLDDAKLGAEKLTSELTTVKEHLKKAQAELQSISDELTAALQNRDSLQRELTDIYKKAEATAEDLKEEKKLVASLNKNLQALEKQVSKDKEARRSLEMDLEEATNSLDKTNRNSVILSSELEGAKSLISSLKNEKEVLSKSLTKQTNASKEAQEKIEDFHNLITRLREEIANLVSRGNNLEGQLSSARAEISRLSRPFGWFYS